MACRQGGAQTESSNTLTALRTEARKIPMPNGREEENAGANLESNAGEEFRKKYRLKCDVVFTL